MKSITESLAKFITNTSSKTIPLHVINYTKTLAFDSIGTLVAATHPKVTSGKLITEFVESQGGVNEASIIGKKIKVGIVNAVLVNSTLGYACDMEPHHPEAILHPMAVVFPTSLSICEAYNLKGYDLLIATALGCEIIYRISMSMDPKKLYELGFHPSAICGTFGAVASAAYLLNINTEQTIKALGLAALQTSGLMAWEDDPKEDARPFQMGIAARNGVTATLLAKNNFGGPDRIFDGGHNVFKAFSRSYSTKPMIDKLGLSWDGVMKLAIKPYSCVSFLHPALDALDKLLLENNLKSSDLDNIILSFPSSGSHCIDNNPLKSHCAQYILPVFAVHGKLEFLDLFEDHRKNNPEISRLSNSTIVVPDHNKLEKLFPKFYACEVTLKLKNGKQFSKSSKIARGYPESPLTEDEIITKFNNLVKSVLNKKECDKLFEISRNIVDASNVNNLVNLLSNINSDRYKY